MKMQYLSLRHSNTTNVKVKPAFAADLASGLRYIQIQPMLRLNYVFKGFMSNTTL